MARPKVARKKKGAPRRRAGRAAGETAATAQGAAEPRSPFVLEDEEIEQALATGESTGMLEDYFGAENLPELQNLARESMRRSRRGGPRVLILPGIMGSKLGRERKLLPDDVIWIDPVDFAFGRLLELALPSKPGIVPLGVILLAYLKLKLRLKIAGFDVDFVPFDWRLSLVDLGATLANRLVAESASKVHLVAHSMGGLVARAAIKQSAPASKKIARLVMLGTPNFGSFSPVQALRATHSTVGTIAALDQVSDAKALASKVFATLPGLHEMLPSPDRWNPVDLYKTSTWTADAPVPKQAMLTAARAVQKAALAAADERFVLVAGVNQETTVGLRVENGSFVYELSREGDGTVPLLFAELPGTRTYYVEESHGSLPNNGRVESAVIDLLRNGETTLLPTQWNRDRARRGTRSVPERDLFANPFEGRRGAALSARDRRNVLEAFVAPDASGSAGAAPVALPQGEDGSGCGMNHSIRNVEVTRRRAHAIEICLAKGSITEARVRAVALGMFRGVEPSGAAAAIDERIEGAVKEFVTRRMFSAEVGEVFVMPVGRHLLYADSVLFAGLGPFDTFHGDVQQFVAENMVRTFVRANVEDFATVLVGASSGWSIEAVLYNQLRGFVRGLIDADGDHRMRRITLCEHDPDRYAAMKQEVYRLASTELFADLVVTFDEVELDEPPPPRGSRDSSPVARISSEASLAYLIVKREENPAPRSKDKDAPVVFSGAVLTRGNKATVMSGSRLVRPSDLEALLAEIEKESFDKKTLPRFGQRLADMVLEKNVARIVKEMRDSHLVVVHDATSSRIPWETICVKGWFPAAEKGISRKYAADNLSVAKWLEQRRIGQTIEVLLIANPTLDLPAAAEEAERLREVFPSDSAIRVDRLVGAEATRDAVLRKLGSGNYDVVHYAGHAFFDPEQRARSGILCHNDEIVSGDMLSQLPALPALAFFNACESARVRSSPKEKKNPSLAMPRRIERNIGLAEAFLRGGVANYIGTYWPVGDDAAAAFAATFYQALLAGRPIGEALQAGRDEVRKISIDWADYVHYGSYDFVLKRP